MLLQSVIWVRCANPTGAMMESFQGRPVRPGWSAMRIPQRRASDPWCELAPPWVSIRSAQCPARLHACRLGAQHWSVPQSAGEPQIILIGALAWLAVARCSRGKYWRSPAVEERLVPTGTKPTLFSPICHLPSGMNVGDDCFAPVRLVVDDSLIGDQQS